MTLVPKPGASCEGVACRIHAGPAPFPACWTTSSRPRRDGPRSSAMTAVGRPGEPQDMAAACIYLASRAGAFVTGVVLPVDGGFLVSRSANA